MIRSASLIGLFCGTVLLALAEGVCFALAEAAAKAKTFFFGGLMPVPVPVGANDLDTPDESLAVGRVDTVASVDGVKDTFGTAPVWLFALASGMASSSDCAVPVSPFALSRNGVDDDAFA